MGSKKKWIIGCSTLLVLTSLIVVYASMTTSGGADANESESTKKIVFNDVEQSDWFYDDVQYVKEKGLMSGTGEIVFSPSETMTRAMVVAVLWRLEGQPKSNDITFDDVKRDTYYYNAVAWAAKNKIVSGYDEKTFGSDDNVTREQIAAIFYRFAGYKGYDVSKKADLSKYTDLETISDYAVNALEWTVANGIITGTSENTISPQGNALRCQVAAILKRFCDTYNTDIDKESASVSQNEHITLENSKKNSTSSSTGGKSNSNSDSQTIGNANNPLITISEATALPGKDVRIVATIKNNPGILGMTLTLNYDETALKLQKAESGNAFRDVLDFTPSKTLSSSSRFVWDGVDITNDKIKDGEIMIMDFHISENAESGKYPIYLNCADGDIVDSNLQAVSVTTETGYITVEK